MAKNSETGTNDPNLRGYMGHVHHALHPFGQRSNSFSLTVLNEEVMCKGQTAAASNNKERRCSKKKSIRLHSKQKFFFARRIHAGASLLISLPLASSFLYPHNQLHYSLSKMHLGNIPKFSTRPLFRFSTVDFFDAKLLLPQQSSLQIAPRSLKMLAP